MNRGPTGPGREPELLAGGSDTPTLRERWNTLPRRIRRATLTVAALALFAAAAGHALTARDEPHHSAGPQATPTHRVPYPAQSTSIYFLDVTHVRARQRTFTIELIVTATEPVTIRKITQGYRMLDVSLDPARPVEVTPQNSRKLRLAAHVTTCEGLPLHARMPFLEVTLRNARAAQNLSVIPGYRYARALARTFRTVCEPA